jgi:hypothetical protein
MQIGQFQKVWHRLQPIKDVCQVAMCISFMCCACRWWRCACIDVNARVVSIRICVVPRQQSKLTKGD